MNRSCFVVIRKQLLLLRHKKYMFLTVEVLHYEKASIKFSQKRKTIIEGLIKVCFTFFRAAQKFPLLDLILLFPFFVILFLSSSLFRETPRFLKPVTGSEIVVQRNQGQRAPFFFPRRYPLS